MMIQDQNNNLADHRVMKTRSLGVEKMIPKLFGFQTWVWNTSSVEKNCDQYENVPRISLKNKAMSILSREKDQNIG